MINYDTIEKDGGQREAFTSILKANEGRKEGAMFNLKSISIVLENKPTGIKLYIKAVSPKRRDR